MENNKYYCKHDAPGGNQDMKCFEKLLKTGYSAISWNFPDLYIIDKIKDNPNFYNKRNETFNTKVKLDELVKF